MLHKFSLPMAVVALTTFALSPLCKAQSVFWSEVQISRSDAPTIEVSEFEPWALDVENLELYLAKAPAGKAFDAKASTFILDLPMPDGRLERFSVVNSPVMAPGLARRFPEIQVFAGQGIDSPEATVRFDLTPQGFHGMILGAGETVYIDPYHPGERDLVIAYTRSAFYRSTTKKAEGCQALEHDGYKPLLEEAGPQKGKKEVKTMGRMPIASNRADNGTQLRTYRLALACTGEYAQFHGGTVPNVLAAMNTSMARVNGIYERDACLTMEIIANNDDLIFLNGNTDPYNNGNGSAMLSENISTCNSIIGSGNYDIGHVYSTGGGGVAYLQSPCGSLKAGGVTGQGAPVGDPFDVDYVAHEMGHQYGGNHTQNNSCNRASSAAYEPGSASTIMGYAGICAPNLQSNSDDHFHNHSINEMIAFTVNGGGNSCAVKTSTGNTIPTVSAGPDGLVVPISTPLELTASGSDADGDALTYNWEQYDLGPATASGDNNLTNPSGNQPIFRSFSSTSSPTRTLPRIPDLVNNTSTIGEFLPDYSRNLQFKCSVRDNRAGGGGFADDLKTLSVTANAGPFLVQSPNGGGTVTGNSILPVSWDVAGTNGNGVNCSTVDIYLSTDGGYTFPTLLLGGTPNDGNASVSLPNVSTSNARIKVKASNNIFFDISNGNFTIEPGISLDYDLAVTSIQGLDAGACGSSTLDPVVVVTNLGLQSVSAFNVTFTIDNGEAQTLAWTGSLGSGESVDVQTCEGGPCVVLADGAHVADASVTLVGATDENASNNSLSTSFETSSGIEVTWTILTDLYPDETTWSVTNDAGEVVWSGGPYEATETTYSESLCLPYGCYTLEVVDSYGDGICCGQYGDGNYTLTAGGEVLASGDDWGTDNGSTPNATSENSFCLEAPAISGCTNPDATNYNPLATVDDGSCIVDTPGCTDPNACNYNTEATSDDGSCTYPDSFETSCGTCTYDCDGTCLADADGDGICDTCECSGCQDESACNYDATATDPGACFFPDPGFNCDGTSLCLEDLNGNGSIDVADVLLVLSEFGCDVDCTADVTGDGFVAVDDVLTVLSLFGEDCN